MLWLVARAACLPEGSAGYEAALNYDSRKPAPLPLPNRRGLPGEAVRFVNDEKLKIAVFIDFDNIQIGVRGTLGRDFDLSLVLEALKERGEVVTKVAYGNWKRAGELSRTLTQNAVIMVQRDLTPRGDKNGADINLALDALETAINHPHINAFVIVGGDSDFIALVEKLKQYNKAVFVVGGRSFTSSILQRNCREFLAYENLVETLTSGRRREAETGRRREVYPLTRGVPLVYRALKVLGEREVQPQLGLLKSTLIQLDSTFNERDYGSGSFRDFVQKLAEAQYLNMRRQGNSYVVEPLDREPEVELAEAPISVEPAAELQVPVSPLPPAPPPVPLEPQRPPEEAVSLLQKVLLPLRGTNPRPLYLRNIKQMLRAEQPGFDEQTYGFASLVDLLRSGQNLNLLRLQRDRKGALRVFIPSPPAATTASEPGMGEAAIPAVNGDETGETGSEIRLDSPMAAPEGADPASGAPAPGPRRRSEKEEEDSQIAVLGFYRGMPGAVNPAEQEESLSLADAVVAEAGSHGQRRGRKPKLNGAPKTPRKRKPRS